MHTSKYIQHFKLKNAWDLPVNVNVELLFQSEYEVVEEI